MRKIRYCILALFTCFCLFSYSQTFFCSKIPYEKLVDNKKYITISYNTVYNIPNYVGEVLTYNMTIGSNKRENDFYREPKYTTVKSLDYSNTGYDRGHMAPAADFKGTKLGMYETFSICNVAMQAPQLNRNWWLKLENLIRKQTKYCNKVYVITGTIVTNTPNSKIAVPSMFYKAIIGIHNNRKVVSCAWLYNNINDKQSIKDTKMSIDKLESILGFDLFPELNKKDKSIEKKIFYF